MKALSSPTPSTKLVSQAAVFKVCYLAAHLLYPANPTSNLALETPSSLQNPTTYSARICIMLSTNFLSTSTQSLRSHSAPGKSQS